MKGLLQMHKDVSAFAQGYKAKGKKDKKDEEVLDDKATLSRFGGDRLKRLYYESCKTKRTESKRFR